ncbi:restriction endonuclease subunit S [Vibrio parahaemolyticus]|uniref:restriction endonuclease subunit S n=1 Tax=Vibrio parahaemolyticus TaxID=670 RepID=UPI001E5474B2|nr:restriction endonuclease subunit S [Vibrio parahaemolyticus]HCH6155856.1 restriction endonuclease subunit S [Vibrio parahaemolyticus]
MAVENLITEHIDVWTSAIKTRSTSGRGSSKKLELYGVKKLRELILDLAVRGKLVPQDPNDEPASELLKRVANEKKLLVNNKKLKKIKKLPDLNDIELPCFELPVGWEWAFIPEVIAHHDYAIKRGPFGSALKKAYFVSSGYKVYEQQHAINDDFKRGEYYVDEDKFQELKSFEVKPNDLIISCSGTVGKVAIAPHNMEPGIINQALLKISLNNNSLINEYFKILFSAYYMKTETLSDLQGTAQKNMVSVETLKSVPFPYPPINEQHRIVAKVDELMALCDQLEQQTETCIEAHQVLVTTLLDTLTNSANADELMQNWARISEHFDTLFTTEESIDQLKQTILQLAVMGKLVPQDPSDEPAAELLKRIAEEKAQLVKEKKIKKEKALPPISEDEKPFELPSGWVWCRLQDITSKITDGDHKTPPRIEAGYTLLSAKNVRDGFIDFSTTDFISEDDYMKSRERCLPEHNDLLIVSVGGTIGRSSLVPKKSDFALVRSVALIKPLKFNSEYLKHAMDSKLLQDSIHNNKRGGAQPCLYLSEISKFPFTMPPLEEQNRIVLKINQLLAICESLKLQIQESQVTQFHLTDAIVEQAV